MNQCPNICCQTELIVQRWIGKWWADKAKDVFECVKCEWRWLEWS